MNRHIQPNAAQNEPQPVRLSAEDFERFNERNHRFGRVFLAAAILLVFLVPVIIAVVLHTMPDLPALFKGLLALIVFIVGGFVEVVTYAPLLGTTGTYLAFFTGNLVNLKVPCAVNARDNIGVRHGSLEGELVSTVSIASSTIVTTLVIAIGVIALTPLTPVLQNPVLVPGFETAFTALFGALAYKYFTRDPKLVPIPLVLTIGLQMLTRVGKTILIPVSAIATILFAYYLFRRENRRPTA